MHTLQGQAPRATSRARVRAPNGNGLDRKPSGMSPAETPGAADTLRWKEQSSVPPGEVPAGQQEPRPLICFSKAGDKARGGGQASGALEELARASPPLHLHLHAQTCGPGCGTPISGAARTHARS